MPIICQRQETLSIFQEARRRNWVIPAFGTENLTTTEAVLSAAQDHARRIGFSLMPVMLAFTNCYPGRRQTPHYTHSRDWRTGLELLLADVSVLARCRFPDLRILLHLDHIQHDVDRDLWSGDLGRFSSIMFDASTLPLDENIRETRAFVVKCGRGIVVEGACDEVASGDGNITRVEDAVRYVRETGVDWVVPHLGTEHRAGSSRLRYAREQARAMSAALGPKLVLHGASSLSPEEWKFLAQDGIAKVNLWTALERDSSPVLLRKMLEAAGAVAGAVEAEKLHAEGLLGPNAGVKQNADIGRFTTAWRQQVVFEHMRQMVSDCLESFCPSPSDP
jgi:fructose/tagatose bisphosphate aldolase